MSNQYSINTNSICSPKEFIDMMSIEEMDNQLYAGDITLEEYDEELEQLRERYLKILTL